MAQLTLPKNSRVNNGKVWDRPEGASRLREYRIYRYDPDRDENPRTDTYFVDRLGELRQVFVNVRDWGRPGAYRCLAAHAG